MKCADINPGHFYTDGKGNIRRVTQLWSDAGPPAFLVDYEIVREGWANLKSRGCTIQTFARWAVIELHNEKKGRG